MHLVIVHGYQLRGTGSNAFVAGLARACRDHGHAVTVVCHDPAAGELAFVDDFVGPKDEIGTTPPGEGAIRVVVPDVGGVLPVFVRDHHDGYRARTLGELTDDAIDIHVSLTADRIRRVARQGVDRVLANHAILGPAAACRGLEDTGVPYDAWLHGSAIEHALVPHPRLVPWALEGLRGAERIFAGSEELRARAGAVIDEIVAKVEVAPTRLDGDVWPLLAVPAPK